MADKKVAEPPFQLKMEPDEKMVFKGKAGEALSVERKITNNTDDRQAFKVKCTANDIFRVRSPLGFIELKAEVVIRITYNGKPTDFGPNKHFFAFYHIKSDKKAEGDKTPRQVWSADAKPLGVAKHICVFELEGNAEGGEKKEVKKEEKKKEKKEEEKKEEKKEEEKKEEEKK